jgi:hypothetical protein
MRTLQGRRHAVGVRGGWWLEQVDWTRKVGHPRTSILYGLLVLFIITRIIRKVFTKTIERNDGTKSVRSKLRKRRTRPKLILTAHTKPISPARTEPVPIPKVKSLVVASSRSEDSPSSSTRQLILITNTMTISLALYRACPLLKLISSIAEVNAW